MSDACKKSSNFRFADLPAASKPPSPTATLTSLQIGGNDLRQLACCASPQPSYCQGQQLEDEESVELHNNQPQVTGSECQQDGAILRQ
jgi:hypothetical protein